MSEHKRIFYFDVLRALAIVGIVFCHVSTIFVLTSIDTPNLYVSAVYNCLRDISIPIFVMLSGALLLNRKDSPVNFFKKRFSRILIPFVFWAIVYAIYFFIYNPDSVSADAALQIVMGMPGTLGVTFWYIWMIMVVYVGIFIINQLIQFGNKRIDGFDTKFINAAAIISIIFILMNYYGFFSQFSQLLFYFASFLSYIIIGYCLANGNFIGDHVPPKAIIAVTLIFSFVAYFYYICYYVVPITNMNNHFTYFGYFNPLIVLISVNVFLSFKYLAKTRFFMNLEDNLVGKGLILISRYSFGIYLMHFIVLKRVIAFFYFISNMNLALAVPVYVIITIVECMVVLWILNKIPYVNRVSGVS